MATGPRRRLRTLAKEGNQVSRNRSLPAPTGGLNDRDAWTSMPATDAISLENWWVEPSRLVTRNGCRLWSELPTPPNTLIEYAATSGVRQLFVAAGSDIFDITDGGVPGPAVVSGLANDNWHAVASNTPADPPLGSYLYLFNGVDKALLYDGIEWKAIDDTSTPSITGVATESLSSGVVYKGRLFMVERSSMNVWYLPPTQLGGAAAAVNLSVIFNRGGYIAGVYTWTLDAGDGADDHLVIITSNGEAAVYTGSDPSNVAAWSLIGVFYLGSPIGDRPAVKFGGDLLVLCEQGIVPLSQALLTASIDRRATITDKIQNSINRWISTARNNLGWQLMPIPARNALLLNVPSPAGPFQYVQNTLTGAWTMFTGWAAKSFLASGSGALYFSAPDGVYAAWEGDSDAGAVIRASVTQAFSAFGTPAQNKYFSLLRPYFVTTGSPSIVFGLSGDYRPMPVSGELSYSPPVGMIWGSMVWGDMTWGGSPRVIQDWITVGNVYRVAAPTAVVQNNNSRVEWSATEVLFEVGGVL